MRLLSSVKSVPTVARFCNPSVPRLASSPLLRLRPSNHLLPTLTLTTDNYSCGFSSFHASTICHDASSSSSVSQSESAQERTSPFRFDDAIDSLVQIFYIPSTPKPLQPWDKSDSEKEEEIGSGFVIPGRRILAESPRSSSLLVKKFRSPTLYKAKIEASSDECGLATLVVDSEEFWEHMHPLELSDDIPSIGERVSVSAYVSGAIQFLEGTISSVERREYYYGTTDEFSIQINTETFYSIGPVVMGNKIVGVYQSYRDNIIPTPEIKHLLNGSGERHIGFGSLDIFYQAMEDAQLRRHFKMSHDMTGVLITEIDPLSKALKVLKKHDVILAIEGLPVNNDGTVHFQKRKWLDDLDDWVSMKKPGETALVKILRDGKEHAFNVSLNFPKQQLVPYQFLPSYYILGGFVFVPLSKPYIGKSSPICDCALKRMAKKAGEQVVIISQVLLDDINKEYSNFKDFEVKKVNGVEVVNLKHLSEFIEKCCTEDLRFDLEKGNVIVLNNKSAKEATSLILERHRIPSAMSNDLQ